MIRWGAVTARRTCDVCGALRDAEPGVFRVIKGRWVCNRHDSYIPREVADAEPYKTFGSKPLKDARPFDPPSMYLADEWSILNFLSAYYDSTAVSMTDNGTLWPSKNEAADNQNGANRLSVSWTAIYCYHLIAEAARPVSMVNAAKALLIKCADNLVDRQLAFYTLFGNTWDTLLGGTFTGNGDVEDYVLRSDLIATDPGYFYEPTSGTGEGDCIGTLALARAYQITGRNVYLTGAKQGCARIRKSQRTDLYTFIAATTRTDALSYYNYAGPPPPGYRYYASTSLLGALALNVVRSIAGDIVIPNTSDAKGGIWSAGMLANLSTIEGELRAFWNTTHAGINGLSTTTPREYWDYNTQSWGFQDAAAATGTKITTSNIAKALWAKSLLGDDVSAFGTWLRTFAHDTQWSLPATTTGRMISGYTERDLWRTYKGTYAASTAPPVLLKVRDSANGYASTAVTAFPIYDFGSLGLLAANYSAAVPSAFRGAKEALAQPRPLRMDGEAQADQASKQALGTIGAAGLSMQPRSAIPVGVHPYLKGAEYGRSVLVERVAQAGLIYRQLPNVNPLRGH